MSERSSPARPAMPPQLRSTVRARLCVRAALIALGLSLFAAAVAPAADPFEFSAGIIVDPELGAVYAMNPEHGIDAIEIGSGKLVWRSAVAAKPLLRAGGRLVAQTEPPPDVGSPLRIALLDPRDAAVQPRFVEVALPAGVNPSIDDAIDRSFAVAARASRAGEVLLRWTYRERPATGAPPGADQTVGRNTTGSARIDLASGRLEPVAAATSRPEPEAPAAVTALIEAGALSGPVVRLGERWVAVERTSRSKEQRVRLRRWDTAGGAELPAVTLYDGGLAFRSLSADQRHLLASRRDPSDGRFWQWSVYSLETGAQLGELRSESAGARFFVQGSVLVHEAESADDAAGAQRALDAVRLDTGKKVWRRAVRDPRYRGPYPARGMH